MDPSALDKASKVLAAAASGCALIFKTAISIEVGTVGRQEQEPCPSFLQGLCCLLAFVNRKIVKDDDVTGSSAGASCVRT